MKEAKVNVIYENQFLIDLDQVIDQAEKNEKAGLEVNSPEAVEDMNKWAENVEKDCEDLSVEYHLLVSYSEMSFSIFINTFIRKFLETGV